MTQMLVSEVWNRKAEGGDCQNNPELTSEHSAGWGEDAQMKPYTCTSATFVVLQHLFFGSPGHFFTGPSDWAQHSSIPGWSPLQQDRSSGCAQVTILNLNGQLSTETAQLLLPQQISCVLSEWCHTLRRSFMIKDGLWAKAQCEVTSWSSWLHLRQ